MKHYFSLILFLAFLSNVSAQRRVAYDLPGSEVSSNVICGKPRVCQCGTLTSGSNVFTYQFAKKPFSPTVTKTSTPKSVALSLLGKSVPISTDDAADVVACRGSNSPYYFSEEIVEFTGSESGQPFKYWTDKTFKIDVNATVKADILELIGSQTISQSLIDSLKATLTAVYKNVKDKKLNITGTYYELRINADTLASMRFDDKYKPCRSFLNNVEQPRAIITDISLLVFDLNRSFNLDRHILVDLEAKLMREGITANLEATIEKNILKGLESSVTNGYAVLSWVKRKL